MKYYCKIVNCEFTDQDNAEEVYQALSALKVQSIRTAKILHCLPGDQTENIVNKSKFAHVTTEIRGHGRKRTEKIITLGEKDDDYHVEMYCNICQEKEPQTDITHIFRKAKARDCLRKLKEIQCSEKEIENYIEQLISEI